MRESTTAEQTTWQRQATILLTSLLALAAKQDLPPITWTIRAAGAGLLGNAGIAPRETFTTWKQAITTEAHRAPGHDREHTFADGDTRLTCDWEHLPVGLAAGSPRDPSASVTLTATIHAEEEGSDGD